MLQEPITVLVQAMVGGPNGLKLRPGKVAILEDSPYVRILVKSGTVTLIDPPSLDPEFLEKAGYALREGYSYPPKVVEPLEGFLTRTPKKTAKVSKEVPDKASEENDSKEDGIKEFDTQEYGVEE